MARRKWFVCIGTWIVMFGVGLVAADGGGGSVVEVASDTKEVTVGFCNSLGSWSFALVDVKATANRNVTFDKDTRIRIHNGAGELALVFVGDKAFALLPEQTSGWLELDVAGTGKAPGTTKYGLSIDVVDDALVASSDDCPEGGRFAVLLASLGMVYPISDGSLGDPAASFNITGMRGFAPRGKKSVQAKDNDDSEDKPSNDESSDGQGSNKPQEKDTGSERNLKDKTMMEAQSGSSSSSGTTAAAAGPISNPRLFLGHLEEDYRLLLYASYSSTELGEREQDDGDSGSQPETPGITEAKQAVLEDSLTRGRRSHNLEFGALVPITRRGRDAFTGFRIGIGASTLRPTVPDQDGNEVLIDGHEPWFGSIGLRFENSYSGFGTGKGLRGFSEIGVRWFGPFGSDESWRYVLSSGLAIPGLNISQKADVYLFIDLDYPMDGEVEDHRIGVFAKMDLSSLFKKSSS